MPLLIVFLALSALVGAAAGLYVARVSAAWCLEYRRRWQEALQTIQGQVREVDAADARAAAANEQVRALSAGADARSMELLRLASDAERRALMAEQELTAQGYLRPRVAALEQQLVNERAERQRLEMAAASREER